MPDRPSLTACAVYSLYLLDKIFKTFPSFLKSSENVTLFLSHGNEKKNELPWPGVLSTHTRPLWASITDFTLVRPYSREAARLSVQLGSRRKQAGGCLPFLFRAPCLARNP
jgi:hypothetical protein